MSDIVPAGQYRAVAVPASVDGQKMWAQFGRSKEKLTPQVAVFFALLDEGPYRGRRLLWMGYFTENSTDRTIEALRLCGFKGDDLAALPSQDLDLEVSVTVENEEYEGKTRAKIAWVNAPGGGLKMSNPMNPTDLRKFAAQYKAKVKAKAVVEGQRVAAPSAAASVAPAEDPEPPEDKGDDPFGDAGAPPESVPDHKLPF